MLATVCGFAYNVLLIAIKNSEQHNEALKQVLHKQSKKGLISFIIFSLSIPAAFIHPVISAVLFISTVFLWIVPDRNIEKNVNVD